MIELDPSSLDIAMDGLAPAAGCTMPLKFAPATPGSDAHLERINAILPGITRVEESGE